MSTKPKPRKPGRPRAPKPLENQIFTRLDDATLKALQEAAAKMERPPAWVIRRAVEEWLERQ